MPAQSERVNKRCSLQREHRSQVKIHTHREYAELTTMIINTRKFNGLPMLQHGTTDKIPATIVRSSYLTNEHVGTRPGSLINLEVLIKLLIHRQIWQVIFTVSMGSRREEPTIIVNQEVNLIKSVVKGIILKIMATSEIIRFQIFPKNQTIIAEKDRTYHGENLRTTKFKHIPDEALIQITGRVTGTTKVPEIIIVVV